MEFILNNFKRLKDVRWALDIGGTLTKCVIFKPTKKESKVLKLLDSILLTPDYNLDIPIIKENTDSTLLFRYVYSNDTLEFIQKLKGNMKPLISILESNLKSMKLYITGGGAHKYCKEFERELNLEVIKLDEMFTIMTGLSYILRQPDEIIRFDLPKYLIQNADVIDNIYPYLLVNIGSGVSILKADDEKTFKRLTGTCLGGGTVLGLAKLLLGITTFEELTELAKRGTNCLDLTVSDIAESSSTLPLDLLASSFGRLEAAWSTDFDKSDMIRAENIARSLIFMIAHNLGYLSYLIGTLHNTYRIIFSGKFVQQNPTIMQAITNGVEFYKSVYYTKHSTSQTFPQTQKSNKSIESNNSFHYNIKPFEILFLKHNGYLGALGAFLARKYIEL